MGGEAAGEYSGFLALVQVISMTQESGVPHLEGSRIQVSQIGTQESGSPPPWGPVGPNPSRISFRPHLGDLGVWLPTQRPRHPDPPVFPVLIQELRSSSLAP